MRRWATRSRHRVVASCAPRQIRRSSRSRRSTSSPRKTRGAESASLRECRGARLVNAVLVPFVLSRVLVIGALGVTRHVLSSLHVDPVSRQQASLLGWDAGWYRDIAAHGYGGVAREGLRFFPLFPMLGRALAWLPGVSAGAGVVFLANVATLALGVALVRARTRRAARRRAARAPRGLARVPGAARVRAGHGLRGGAVHDRHGRRALGDAFPALVDRGARRTRGGFDPPSGHTPRRARTRRSHPDARSRGHRGGCRARGRHARLPCVGPAPHARLPLPVARAAGPSAPRALG